MNDEPTAAPDPVAKKPPRKPKAKPKANHKLVKKAVKSKTKGKRSKPAKSKRNAPGRPGVIRTERLDLRLTKQEKAKIMARSRKTKRTVTSVIMEAIHKVKW